MSTERMAAAAEILRKGGTLVPEACSACKGVQVKYSGKIICVNCGTEEDVAAAVKAEPPTQEKTRAPAEAMNQLRETVAAKINELLPTLKAERDISKQYEITKLLMRYLEILEKAPETPKEKESRQ
ncbi:MAG: Sjogren's syndrome/scleroderma autoantigen 1 family protein [Nitrososphaerales archaeon]